MPKDCSSLVFHITSAAPATVSGRRVCRVHAYADLACKRTIMEVGSHNSAGYYQGKRAVKGPSARHGKRGIRSAFKKYGRRNTRSRQASCTSWATPSIRIKAMARKRIVRAARILCQRHRLPRMTKLRLTRTYRMKQVITKNHYLCTQTFLYSYTCSQ